MTVGVYPKQLSDGGPSGTVLGTATTDLIAFHNSTPIAQASVASLVTGATIATVVTTVQAVMTALVNKGLIALS